MREHGKIFFSMAFVSYALAILFVHRKGWCESMSFTQDELQTLNTIFEQKLAELLPALEQLFDQRLQTLRNEFEQYQQRLEESIERSFVTQLPVIEQLLNQRFPTPNAHVPDMYTYEPPTNFEAIEVQTEIPWEDLIDLLTKALNERFITFNRTLQARLHDIEQEVSSQIQFLRDDLHKQQPTSPFSGRYNTEASMQDILTSMNQLERIVESMQVAMSANNALISQRLYHHQRQPMEQAHPPHSFSPTEQEHSLRSEWNLAPSPSSETDD